MCISYYKDTSTRDIEVGGVSVYYTSTVSMYRTRPIRVQWKNSRHDYFSVSVLAVLARAYSNTIGTSVEKCHVMVLSVEAVCVP